MLSDDSLKMRSYYNNKNLVRAEFACFGLLPRLASFEIYERFYKTSKYVWYEMWYKYIANKFTSCSEHWRSKLDSFLFRKK